MFRPFELIVNNQSEFVKFVELVSNLKYQWLISIDAELPDVSDFPILIVANRFGKVSQTPYFNDSSNAFTFPQLSKKPVEWFTFDPPFQNMKIVAETLDDLNHWLNYIDANGYTIIHKNTNSMFPLLAIKKTPVLILKEDGTAEFITLKQSTQKKYSHYPLKLKGNSTK